MLHCIGFSIRLMICCSIPVRSETKWLERRRGLKTDRSWTKAWFPSTHHWPGRSPVTGFCQTQYITSFAPLYFIGQFKLNSLISSYLTSQLRLVDKYHMIDLHGSWPSCQINLKFAKWSLAKDNNGIIELKNISRLKIFEKMALAAGVSAISCCISIKQ